jgi:hypothetical protein
MTISLKLSCDIYSLKKVNIIRPFQLTRQYFCEMVWGGCEMLLPVGGRGDEKQAYS